MAPESEPLSLAQLPARLPLSLSLPRSFPPPPPLPALLCPELVVAVAAAALRRSGLCVFVSKQEDNWDAADEFPHLPDILQPIGACESFAPLFISYQRLHLQHQTTSCFTSQ